jgi:hypothetical protein
MAVMLLVVGVAERRIDSDGCGHADKQAALGPAVGVVLYLFSFRGVDVREFKQEVLRNSWSACGGRDWGMVCSKIRWER